MMQKKSKHVVIGAIISMVILLLQMVAALLKVRIILSHYGYEFYSIFQGSNGIFSYLILIEGGFGVAYLLKMYEPYTKHDIGKMQSLYLGLEIMLKKVAALMLIGVIVITIIYPLVLAENRIDNLEVTILVGLCGLKAVIPYFFVSAKKQFLNVIEKSYLTSIIDSTLNLISDVFVIMIALFTNWSFIIVIIVSVLMLIPSICIYSIIISYYKRKLHFTKNAIPSYEASSMTKDIMAQKIAFLADNNVDQIILSMRDLLQTTIYTSFNSVVSYPVSLTNQLISSFRGHIGVRLAENAEESYRSFRKLFSMNYYIATVITCEFILQAQSFVKLWIGDAYSTDNITLFLFAIILFRKCAENAVTITREGKNLYKKSKKYALTAAMTNFILSLILVQVMEIRGLLIGTIIADVFVLDYNNYRLVFLNIFSKKIDAWRELIPSIISIGIVLYIRYFSSYAKVAQSSWLIIVEYSLATTIIIAIMVGTLYLITSKYMREAVKYFLPKRIRVLCERLMTMK